MGIGRGRISERSIAALRWLLDGPGGGIADPFLCGCARGAWQGGIVGLGIVGLVLAFPPGGGPVDGVAAVQRSGTTAGRLAAVHGAPCARD